MNTLSRFIFLLFLAAYAHAGEISDLDTVQFSTIGHYNRFLIERSAPALHRYKVGFDDTDDTDTQCHARYYFREVPASTICTYWSILALATSENLSSFRIYSEDMDATVYMNLSAPMIPLALRLRQAERSGNRENIITLERMLPVPQWHRIRTWGGDIDDGWNYVQKK